MLIATHSIVAGSVGAATRSPLLAFSLGIIVHFLLDAIPHYDTTDDGKITRRQIILIVVDAIVGLCVIFFVLKPPLYWRDPFWWGMIGGNLPDFFDHFPGVQRWFRDSWLGSRIHGFHELIQKYWKQPAFVPGIVIQIILVGLFSYIYLSSKH